MARPQAVEIDPKRSSPADNSMHRSKGGWAPRNISERYVTPLESLIERILVQMSQDFGQVHKSFLFCGDETSRRQWCTKRFELGSTASATYLDKPSRDLSALWSASMSEPNPPLWNANIHASSV
jgi:hypothetical protein